MSHSDDAKPSSVVQLREAESFPELQIDFTDVATEPVVETVAATETKTEFLPVVITQTDTDTVTDVTLDPGVTDDTYVPDDIEQRLIYHWLLYGPVEWRADIVEPAPPIDNINGPPVINPLHFRRPRQIGHRDDGVRRTIRPRV